MYYNVICRFIQRLADDDWANRPRFLRYSFEEDRKITPEYQEWNLSTFCYAMLAIKKIGTEKNGMGQDSPVCSVVLYTG